MQQIHRFDTHIHTAETSKCGRISAPEMVDIYHKLGYQGIAITDHLHEEYISLLYCRDDWDTCVDRFLDGYRRAKERGDQIGLQVVLGAEVRFEQENENDYLVYGIDEAFLRRNPYPFRLGHQAFFDRFGGEVLIIHAHPFRNDNDVVYHECVHGIEIVNGNPRHDNYNQRALELCKRNPRLLRMCGSDTHRPGDQGFAWVDFQQPITDSFQLKAAMESGRYTLGCKDPADQLILEEERRFFAEGERRIG